MKCPECKGRMGANSSSMSFKIGCNVIVQSVKSSKCSKCGFDCISSKEYERVRKLIHSVKAPPGATVVLP